MKTNFHTHHELCRHAGGNAEDYIKEAVKHGFTEIGFSDHAPNDTYDFGYRMRDEDFLQYVNDINTTKRRYSDILTTYIGLEIEHLYDNGEYHNQFKDHLDYFILGQHFIFVDKDPKKRISSFGLTSKEEIIEYGNILCDAMKTKRYKIVAHPELYLYGYLDFDATAEQVARQICECANRTNTILEYNGNGYRRDKIQTNEGMIHPYPRQSFWNIAEEYNVRSILSSDCHSPKQLYDDTMKEVEEIYSKLSTRKVTYFEQF
ncbi:PHP domain-containing protein [Candidatus Xianfuyuplasma coldseepsis]|uniref:Histidinol-phosphatase n=1 Tax=Candidatus Xianfuyuplasma coldseepsis TaxID=2782163 RepID=A0A7L7KUY0_9MOLU|nr:PHP domain-containing protein [Xianfuyuplasma coldseepsis]QMS85804.1 PHP domain-containing protein [Xianfuyuplasma coldseepsis]